MSNIDKIKAKLTNYSFMYAAYNLLKYIGIKYFYNYTLKMKFKDACGYSLNLENPKTFSEKIQWIKVNIHDPKMSKCADKLSVREYVKEKIKDIYIPEVYAIWHKAEEINFDVLPDSFVLKSNHGSGEVIIVKNKARIDIDKTKNEIAKWLTYNYYYRGGEWVYKDITPAIFAEELLEENMIDYKFYCFNGQPKFLYLSQGLAYNHDNARMNYLWLDWTKTPFQREDYLEFENIYDKPEFLNQMINISTKLSEGFLFCRVDLYCLKDKGVVFSEMTFYPGGGFAPFTPFVWEEKIGEWLRLPCEEEE